jgi:hypothetical protein
MRVFVQNDITPVQTWLSGKKYIKKISFANALTRSTYDVCPICFQKKSLRDASSSATMNIGKH